MGLFSADCKLCGHPILFEGSATSANAWMRNAVVIRPNGEMVSGLHDGYGHLVSEGQEHSVFMDVSNDGLTVPESVYHRDCWQAAGSPAKYDGPSRNAADQGYWFDPPAHDMPSPLNTPRRQAITAVEPIDKPAYQSPYTPTWRAPARLTLEDGSTIEGFIHGRTKTAARKKAAELAAGITTPIFAVFNNGEFIGTE